MPSPTLNLKTWDFSHFSLSLPVFLFGGCNFRCPSSSPMVTVSWRTRTGIVKQIWFLNSFAFYKRCHVFDITYKLFQWECSGKAEKEERWRTGIGTLNGRWNWARSEAEEKQGRWEERYAKTSLFLATNREKGKRSLLSISLFLHTWNKNIRMLKVQPADNRGSRQTPCLNSTTDLNNATLSG